MIIKGIITAIEAIESGTGKNGEAWQKRTFVIKYSDTPFVKEAAVEIWGDLVNSPFIILDSGVIAHIDIITKKHDGKYYNTIKVWRLLPRE
jgi:hypothetical protein